ncbi:hypothetical protein WG66_007450 [Moniliophthora roreri]|nr:hypothetical protein WG66_007450 [Moniliophthora roreri]
METSNLDNLRANDDAKSSLRRGFRGSFNATPTRYKAHPTNRTS